MEIDTFIETYYNAFKRNFKYYFKRALPDSFTVEFFDKFRNKSQRDKILWHLETFGYISNKQCFYIYGFCHLPGIIRDLRERFKFQNNGYKIENERIIDNNKWGKKSFYDKYTLVKGENITA